MKIGTCVVPESRLEKLLIVTKTIYDRTEGKEVNTARIAEILRLALKGGGFNGKMQDLESYGLIERGKNTVRVTELGKQLTYPRNDAEKEAATLEAVNNIELWKKLLERVGVSVTQANFPIYLEDLAGAERSVAKDSADKIRKAYLKDVALIKTVGSPTVTAQTQEAFGVDAADGTSTMEAQHIEPKIPVIIVESQDVRVRKPAKDIDTYLKELEKLKSLATVLYEEKQEQGGSQGKTDGEDNGSAAKEPVAEETVEKTT